MAQPQGTLDQTVALWLKSQEIKDFSFKEFEISLSDYPGYRKKLSEATEAVHTTFYTAYEKLYNDNPLARPLLLKYILDKERDVVEEVVIENFLNNLVQKISENYNESIEEKSKEREKCEDDKEKLKDPESQRLTKVHEQYSAKIQNNIKQLDNEIERIQDRNQKLNEYNTYIDRIKARDQTLLHAEKYTPDILHDMLSTKVEKKFTEYFKQLDVKKTKEKYLNIYYKVKSYKEFVKEVTKSNDGSIVPVFISGLIVMFIVCAFVSVYYESDPAKGCVVSMGIYLGIVVTIALLITVPTAVTTAVKKRAVYNSINDLVVSDLNPEQKVSTPEKREPASTSKLQEIGKDQENNVEFQHSNNVNLSGIQDNISIYPSLSNAEEAEGQKNTETQHDPYAPNAPPAEMVNAKVSSQNYNSSKVKLD